MFLISEYQSPMGSLWLSADKQGLNGLWFDKDKLISSHNRECMTDDNQPYITEAKRWLDIYFGGDIPDFKPQIHLNGNEYQIKVWETITEIEYGKTMTYGEIARKIANQKNVNHVAAQAVGGAVGRNPLPIIIPCHRVMGADGSITGFSAGIEKKIFLLKHEGIILM